MSTEGMRRFRASKIAGYGKIALARLGWRFFIEGNYLWVKVLRPKYGDLRATNMGEKNSMVIPIMRKVY